MLGWAGLEYDFGALRARSVVRNRSRLARAGPGKHGPHGPYFQVRTAVVRGRF